MDDREQQRKVRHRLAVLRHAEEVTGNVAAKPAAQQCINAERQVFIPRESVATVVVLNAA